MNTRNLLNIYYKLLKNSIKELSQITKIYKKLPLDKSSSIIDATLSELDEHSERISLRQGVANLKSYDSFRDFHLTTITKNNEKLNGFIEAEDQLGKNNAVAAIESIIETEEDEIFDEDKVRGLINYFKARRDCAFPEIANFMDDNISELSDDEFLLGAVATVFNGYKKSTILEPFNLETKKQIFNKISFIETSDLDIKNKESLIKIVNASILTTREYTSQIRGKDDNRKLELIINPVDID